MKGVILAGGLGTRLLPLTKITTKHLLPVYDKPMIYYPLETLAKAGIKEIIIVTGPENPGDFIKLLGNGEEFNVNLTYRLQKNALGIAHALSLVEDFADGNNIAVILGDNIFEDNFKEYINKFKDGAHLFLKEVPDPQRFGVAEFNKDEVISIEEKPINPKTKHAVTGFYLYDNKVFDIIKTLKPSARNELEITDVNNKYIEKQEMKCSILKGYWTDAGTFESLHRASNLIKNSRNIK